MANGQPNVPATHVAGEAARPAACIISTVNKKIRKVDPYGYIPERVRIGPFHRDKSHLMEEEKKKRLYRALAIDHQEALKPYLENMAQRHENHAREQYNSLFSGMTSEDFVLMLLLDGYFVLSHCGLVRSEAGWKGKKTRVSNEVYDRDVFFLLENQVPFFILEEIYKLLDPAPNSLSNFNYLEFLRTTIAKTIKTLVCKNNYVHNKVDVKLMETNKDEHPCHLLHLLYKYFRPANLGSDQSTEDEGLESDQSTEDVGLEPDQSTEYEGTDFPPTPRWRSATYYHTAGVRLAKRNLDGKEARSILDVKLKNGTLQVPCLEVHIDTLTMLRNMVALEQHHYKIGSHVAIYCFFMSKLANTEEDVRLLSSKGILVNHLCSDKDAVDGFANLCRGVSINLSRPEFNYLRPIMWDLEKLCHSRWGKSMAWLRHNKCNNILMALIVVAGIIIFLCNVVQASFAALSYGKQKP